MSRQPGIGRVIAALERLPPQALDALVAFLEAAEGRPAPVAPVRRAGPGPESQRPGWMNTREASEYLGFTRCADPVRAFRKFVKRSGIASARRGRVMLFAVRDLDAAIGAAHRALR